MLEPRPLLLVDVVGLTPSLLGENTPHINALLGRGRMACMQPVFPAVTTTVQSSMLTGLPPSGHGIVGNGWYFRDQAEVFATQQIKGSSSTSVTPGAGAKSFVIETNRSFVTGMYVVATSTSDTGTSMSGYVQSYDPSTGALVLGVDQFSGPAPKADWVIGVAAKGAAGLTVQIVTANTTAVAGVHYIVTVAGITLTMPAAAEGRVKVTNASPGLFSVNWQGKTVRDMVPDAPMRIPRGGEFDVTGAGGNWA